MSEFERFDDEEPKTEQVAEEVAEAQKPVTVIEEHPAYSGQDSQYYVTSVSGRKHHTNSTTIQRLRDEGLTDEQIGLRLDEDQDKIWAKIREDRAKMEQMEEMEEDGSETEDPLAGDVDRWVAPDPPETHADRVARHYGDYTG